MVVWQLPWPGVTTNHLYVRTSRGLRLCDRAAAWRDEVMLIVRQSGQRLPAGPIALSLFVWPPNDHRKHDLDNLAKLSQDALFAAYGDDDSRVVELHLYREKTERRIRGAKGIIVAVAETVGEHRERGGRASLSADEIAALPECPSGPGQPCDYLAVLAGLARIEW